MFDKVIRHGVLFLRMEAKNKPLVAQFESAYSTTKEMEPGDKIRAVIRFEEKELTIREVLGIFTVATEVGRVSVYAILNHTRSRPNKVI